MRVFHINLNNFRAFAHITLNIDRHMTVIVGGNGSGKSTIMDGLAISLASFLSNIHRQNVCVIQACDVHEETRDQGNHLERQVQYPAVIQCAGTVFGKQVTWSRSLVSANAVVTHDDVTQITGMWDSVRRDIPGLILPVLCYYGSHRLCGCGSFSDAPNLNSRFAGYENCLDGTIASDKLLYPWLEHMTCEGDQDSPTLQAVNSTIIACLNALGQDSEIGHAIDCHYNVITHDVEITCISPDGKKILLALSKLSDGLRGILCMVADIACRMALLNPHLRGYITAETDGIVLIDDIELHLHPSLQRHIVRILRTLFPRIQFVLTSHAPSIISSVPSEEIIILKGGQAYTPVTPTYGKDDNAILTQIMHVPIRQDDAAAAIDQFHTAFATDELETAKQLLLVLKTMLGENDPAVVSAEMALDLAILE
ncbi:MAG: AAA family ATPase [Clostridia bacterium]|nr:AAA family ATPase [Clostridia bacterium]MBR1684541.1 AAA family ATPase [Clostridia bacterium]